MIQKLTTFVTCATVSLVVLLMLPLDGGDARPLLRVHDDTRSTTEAGPHILTNRNLKFYGDAFWDELPKAQQDAATSLGYSKKLWNQGGTAKESDLWFECLSPAQQKAAKQLGYTAKTWNGGPVKNVKCKEKVVAVKLDNKKGKKKGKKKRDQKSIEVESAKDEENESVLTLKKKTVEVESTFSRAIDLNALEIDHRIDGEKIGGEDKEKGDLIIEEGNGETLSIVIANDPIEIAQSENEKDITHSTEVVEPIIGNEEGKREDGTEVTGLAAGNEEEMKEAGARLRCSTEPCPEVVGKGISENASIPEDPIVKIDANMVREEGTIDSREPVKGNVPAPVAPPGNTNGADQNVAGSIGSSMSYKAANVGGKDGNITAMEYKSTQNTDDTNRALRISAITICSVVGALAFGLLGGYFYIKWNERREGRQYEREESDEDGIFRKAHTKHLLPSFSFPLGGKGTFETQDSAGSPNPEPMEQEFHDVVDPDISIPDLDSDADMQSFDCEWSYAEKASSVGSEKNFAALLEEIQEESDAAATADESKENVTTTETSEDQHPVQSDNEIIEKGIDGKVPVGEVLVNKSSPISVPSSSPEDDLEAIGSIHVSSVLQTSERTNDRTSGEFDSLWRKSPGSLSDKDDAACSDQNEEDVNIDFKENGSDTDENCSENAVNGSDTDEIGS